MGRSGPAGQHHDDDVIRSWEIVGGLDSTLQTSPTDKRCARAAGRRRFFSAIAPCRVSPDRLRAWDSSGWLVATWPSSFQDKQQPSNLTSTWLDRISTSLPYSKYFPLETSCMGSVSSSWRSAQARGELVIVCLASQLRLSAHHASFHWPHNF